MKGFLERPRDKSKVQILLIAGIILSCSLITIFGFSLVRSQTAQMKLSALATQAIQTRTSSAGATPEEKVAQFYNYLIANNYNDAYLLLSTNIRQSFELQGGVSAFQGQMQTYNHQYGNVTTYIIESHQTRSGTDQIVTTVQIHRSKLKAQQKEVDTLTLISEANVWLINQWGFTITNSSS